MKTLLNIKFELLLTPLFIVLFVLSIKYIGFTGVKETLFTIIVLLEIPTCYYGVKLVRKLLKEVWCD